MRQVIRSPNAAQTAPVAAPVTVPVAMPVAQPEQTAPAPSITQLTSLLTNQDMIKFMMNNWDQLNHLPAAVNEALKNMLKHPSCDGNVKKLAEILSNEVAAKLKTEKVKDSFNSDFDPIACTQDILGSHLENIIVTSLETRNEQSFKDWQEPLRSVLEGAVGEVVDELAGEFNDGEEGVWAWISYNLSEQNLATAPPNMAMMANMKS